MTAWRPRQAWYAPWDTGPGFMTCNGYVPFLVLPAGVFVVSRRSEINFSRTACQVCTWLVCLWPVHSTSAVLKTFSSIRLQMMVIVYVVLNGDSFISGCCFIWFPGSSGTAFIFLMAFWRMSCEADRDQPLLSSLFSTSICLWSLFSQIRPSHAAFT